VVLWSGNHIGHHSVIQDNCFISSHVVVSGFCNVGANSFLGVNATLANNITIGEDNWIGLGVTIAQNTEPNALFKGARPEPEKIGARRFFKVPEN
jgi:carbonic anhydrase/acetyltransferase-like protein (isoleucine patch superfamily)